MAGSITLIADGHVHFYPAYDLGAALGHLIRNLDRIAGAPPGTPVFRLALLAEAGVYRFFDQIRDGNLNVAPAGLTVRPMAESQTLEISVRDQGAVCLIAGRQVATRERLEVIGIGLDRLVPDGRPAAETIERIREAGGLPLLPWAVGKWLFGRGRLVHQLIDRYARDGLSVGDSALRPTLWPTPRWLHYAQAQALAIIPGTDPLPLPGDEGRMGTYGFTCEGPFDTEKPLAALRTLIATRPASIRPAGRRCGLPAALRLQLALRKLQRS